MPTLAELAGVEPPAHIDGLSIVPTLLGEAASGRAQDAHEFLYWEYVGKVAVRMGDWKLVKPGKNKEFELYDLSRDIEEKQDVAKEHPQILQQLIECANKSHEPVNPGEVFDKELLDKDHNAGKKPGARRKAGG
jgi:arylsulfatase